MPRNRFANVLLVSISVTALAACSSSSDVSQAKTSAPMPPITEMDAAMSSPAPQPLPLSDSDTLTPVMAQGQGAPANETMEDRIARLEQSVSAMQSDYQKLMPAFASLNTTNARIQTLLGEIEKETGKQVAAAEAPAPIPVAPQTNAAPKPILKTTPAAQVEETVPATGVLPPPGAVSRANPAEPPAKAIVLAKADAADAPAQQAYAPPLSAFKEQPTAEEARIEAARQTAGTVTDAPVSGGEATVTGVRIGEHGNKTRLVFDLDAKTKPSFKYDLDNVEKLLVVEMPSSVWAGSQSGSPKSPLVESWSADKGAAGGSTVAIQLKKDARVLSTEFLKAEGNDPARLVVDIAPQG